MVRRFGGRGEDEGGVGEGEGGGEDGDDDDMEDASVSDGEAEGKIGCEWGDEGWGLVLLQYI